MILEVTHISKSYKNGTRNLAVLSDISLSADQGEIITIMGSSGSGKSTLMNILGTLDKADEGTVRICDKKTDNLDDRSLAELRNKHIGFVFQFHHLLPEFTAIENVLMPAEISGISTAVKTKANELFDYVGLNDRKEYFPSQLSGGEKQRVAVMRALINSPELVLTDEPTGNLDKKNGEKLLDLFTQISKDFHQTVIMTTHDEKAASTSPRLVSSSNMYSYLLFFRSFMFSFSFK